MATFLTGVLAILDTCLAMAEKEGDLEELVSSKAISLVRVTPAPTVRDVSETFCKRKSREKNLIFVFIYNSDFVSTSAFWSSDTWDKLMSMSTFGISL